MVIILPALYLGPQLARGLYWQRWYLPQARRLEVDQVQGIPKLWTHCLLQMEGFSIAEVMTRFQNQPLGTNNGLPPVDADGAGSAT